MRRSCISIWSRRQKPVNPRTSTKHTMISRSEIEGSKELPKKGPNVSTRFKTSRRSPNDACFSDAFISAARCVREYLAFSSDTGLRGDFISDLRNFQAHSDDLDSKIDQPASNCFRCQSFWRGHGSGL